MCLEITVVNSKGAVDLFVVRIDSNKNQKQTKYCQGVEKE